MKETVPVCPSHFLLLVADWPLLLFHPSVVAMGGLSWCLRAHLCSMLWAP